MRPSLALRSGRREGADVGQQGPVHPPVHLAAEVHPVPHGPRAARRERGGEGPGVEHPAEGFRGDEAAGRPAIVADALGGPGRRGGLPVQAGGGAAGAGGERRNGEQAAVVGDVPPACVSGSATATGSGDRLG